MPQQRSGPKRSSWFRVLPGVGGFASACAVWLLYHDFGGKQNTDRSTQVSGSKPVTRLFQRNIMYCKPKGGKQLCAITTVLVATAAPGSSSFLSSGWYAATAAAAAMTTATIIAVANIEKGLRFASQPRFFMISRPLTEASAPESKPLPTGRGMTWISYRTGSQCSGV